MEYFTGMTDVRGNKLYINDMVIFKRKNRIEKGNIISKSHQFRGTYFIEVQGNNGLLPLNVFFIEVLKIVKIKNKEAGI